MTVGSRQRARSGTAVWQRDGDDMLEALKRVEHFEAAQKAAAQAAVQATQSNNSQSGRFEALAAVTPPSGKMN